MKISKKLRSLAIGGLVALNSFMPLKAIADTKNVSILNTPISIAYDKDYHNNELKLDLKNKYDDSVGLKEVIKKAPETIALCILLMRLDL